jgi:hypothetical protein
MRSMARVGWCAVVAALCVWIGLTLFPSPQKVIRKNLQHLARSVSFSPTEGALARLAHAQNLADFFSTNVEVNLDIPGHGGRRFADRDEIVQAALAARSAMNALTVEFPNIAINLGPDKQTASAELTMSARVSDERDTIVQEMKFTLEKINGQWLITRVQTVRVFSWGSDAVGQASCLPVLGASRPVSLRRAGRPSNPRARCLPFMHWPGRQPTSLALSFVFSGFAG